MAQRSPIGPEPDTGPIPVRIVSSPVNAFPPVAPFDQTRDRFAGCARFTHDDVGSRTMTDDRSPPRSATERYRLRREVASGGMATVYLAEDVVLARPVALKILTKALAADKAFVDRFRREAQAAARFRHPNIVTVYDWGPYEDSFFIAMEYIEGRTLGEVIAEDGPLAATEAARIAGEIVAALEVAHGEGLVHRDIKPSNIIITPAGQVRIADFGIARARNAGVDLTQVGMIVGTSAYLSPEQAQGLDVDQRSDLYSLGVVLFEMVTGEPPFTGDSALAVATQHVSSPAPRLRSRQPSLPVELDELVDRLLAKNPDDRFRSATELAPELGRIQTGEFATSPPTATSGGGEDHEPTAVMASTTGSAPAPMANADDEGRAIPATEIMPESLRPDRRPDPRPAVPVQVPEPSPSPSSARSGSTPTGLLVGGAAAVVVVVVAALTFLASGIGSGGSEETDGATTTTSTGQATSTTPTTEGETSTVEVPNLVGRSRGEAERVVSELGLVPSVEEVEVEDPAQVGQVVAQNPQAEQQVETGSTVVIQVGRAASTTTTTTLATTTTTTTTATTVPPQTESTIAESTISD